MYLNRVRINDTLIDGLRLTLTWDVFKLIY